MNTADFRRAGHELIDWVADYLDNAEQYPVLPDMQPGDLVARLPERAPEQAEPIQSVWQDFLELVLPAVTHWNHPRFFAYFPANHSGPSILAELLSAALGVNGMVWQSCPAATELEQVVMGWLAKLLDLPADFTGVIQDTASTATLCALLCARESTTGFAFNQSGPQATADAGPLVVYASSEAHSSVTKGAKIAGFGAANVNLVAVDADRSLDPDDLASRIQADRAAGKVPCCVCATVGTTSSTAIDPLGRIGTLTQREGLWLHVDAALAGSAAIVPEMRWILDGIELADSFVFNPHKWLLTNFDCSAYYTRHPQILTRTFSILPEYLKTAHDQQAVNFRDWGIPLGRRFRALKLWFVLRHYGAEGLRTLIREHLALAQDFAAWVDGSDDFERLAPVPLQTICFRYNPDKGQATPRSEEAINQLNQTLLEAVNRTGQVFMTHTSLEGRFCLRLSIGQASTRARHVEQAKAVLLAQRPK